MLYNKISLAFPEGNEILFRKKYFSDSIVHFRIAFVIVSILYGLFGQLDSLVVSEYLKVFYWIRYFIVIPVFLVVLLLSFTKLFYKIWQALLLFSFVIGGTGISIMVILMPENFAYYGGLMLVFSAGYFFIKLRFLLASIAGWLTLIFYNIGAIFYADVPNMVLINNNFFFISANLIGMVASYNIEYYARRNFFLNHQLDKEKLITEGINKVLEKKVDERTQELLIAKEIAEANNANLTAIIEGTKANIWAFNQNYEILYINKAFQTEFYQTFGTWIEKGVNLIESLPKELQQLWKMRYDRVLENEHFTIDDSIEMPSGMIYIQVTFNPIVNKGKVVGGSCFGNVVTDAKNAELELIRAKEKAEESDRLKTAFLQNMSHEIRTPMNAIVGFSGLLIDNFHDKSNLEKFVAIINQRSNDLLNIINDILDISKIESSQVSINYEACNIEALFAELDVFFTEYQKSLSKKFIDFSLHCYLKHSSFINTDPVKLKQILTNLIGNAFKYTDKGTIVCTCERKNDCVIFKVSDTGIGIPEYEFDYIFERFAQVHHNSMQNVGGTGLGLSIAKGLVNLLGGEIWLESAVNKGTTFYFTIQTPPKDDGND
jgi:signal transduction histidine kinase